MTESFDLTAIHISYEGESDVDGKLPPAALTEDAAMSHGGNEEAPLTEDVSAYHTDVGGGGGVETISSYIM